MAKAAVIALLGVFFIATAQSFYTFDHDMSLYLGLARSLARGDGFVFNGSFNDQVPPGLPLLLWPVAEFVSTDNTRVFQWLIALFGVLALYLTWAWARAAQRPYPWLTALLVALLPGFYSAATGRVYAETPFMVMSLLVLWWAERAVDPEGRARRWTVVTAVAVCALAVPALRTVGIALPVALVAAVLHDTVRRRRQRPAPDWRPAAVVIAAAAFAFVFTWSRVVAAKATSGYGGGFAPSYMAHLTLRNSQIPDSGTVSMVEVGLRVPGGLLRQTAHMAEMATGIGWIQPTWLSPIILLVGVLVAVGWWRTLRREQPLAAWYAALYVAIVAIWPFDEGQRFLIPVAPLLVAFAIDGAKPLYDVAASVVRTRWRSAVALLAVVAALALVAARPWSQELSRQDVAAIAAWPALIASLFVFRWLLVRHGAHRVGALLGGVALVVFTLGNARQVGRLALARSEATPDGIRLIGTARAAEWLAQHAPRDAVVMAGEYAAVHYRTELRTVPLLSTGRAEVLGATLRCARPDYVVITDSLPHPYTLPVEPRRFEAMQASGAGMFEEVAALGGGRVYRFAANAEPCPQETVSR